MVEVDLTIPLIASLWKKSVEEVVLLDSLMELIPTYVLIKYIC